MSIEQPANDWTQEDIDADQDEERDDSPYCDCGAIPSQEEEDLNLCGCCGKRLE